jgi:hypothetical protein
MNSCKYVESIIDYRLGQLTDEQEREFEIHLKSCAVCQQELALEQIIENELAVEFRPGLIENRIMARLRLREAEDMRSFWLYAYRMTVLGISAAIACVVLVPFLLHFPLKSFPDLGKYASGLAEFVDGLVPANPIFIIIGFCYMLLVVSSIYSLTYARR